MPRNKDFKRLVRARMEKTGESYTAARRRLLEKKPAPAPEPDLAARAGMSDATLRARTGRTWEEWVHLLDAFGAVSKPHAQIARHLAEEHGVPGWWAQTVTVGYERIRGLRDVGQRRGGGYEASKSKTLAVPLDRLYRAFATPAGRRRWLAGARFSVKKANPGKTMRLRWSDGTPVEAYFVAKGEAKSQVAVQHRGLASKQDAARVKAYWTERLETLAAALARRPKR